MAIVNSEYILDPKVQADGRQWVKEIHTDATGKKYYAEYLASPDFDFETCLTTRAATISGDLDRKDAALNEGSKGLNMRKIRQDAFLDRFTPTEQAKIEASEDITMRVFKNNAIVIVRPYINLDHGLVQYALPVLRDAGILDGETKEERQARMDAILADGTIGEI